MADRARAARRRGTKPRTRRDRPRPVRDYAASDHPPRNPGAPAGTALQTMLRAGILAGIALIVLTPLVVTPQLVYPFVVGKALWSRSIIEVVFVLWAALALANPSCRPPRSPLLVLLAAGLGASLLAAVFGVGFQRSIWSSYERMQGVVDLAHWFAFAVVLVSVLRTGREWRALLGVNLAAGAAIALIVIARRHEIDIPFFGDLPERAPRRMSGPFGNPIYLGTYMVLNAMIALGLATRCFLRGAEPEPAHPRERRRMALMHLAGGLPWAAVAALHLWAMVLAQSASSFVGLAAGAGFTALACLLLTRGRRRAAVAAVIVLGAVTAAGIFGPHDGNPPAQWAEHVAAPLRVKLNPQNPSLRSRLAAWEASAEGFAARPVLGWGPENFDAVFGRFASGYGATMVPHDRSHGKVFEVAATTGAVGLAAWLALWSAVLTALWRSAREADRRERALIVGVGAALVAHLVQTQALFDTTPGSLQLTVALAFVAGLRVRCAALGRSAAGGAPPPAVPGPLRDGVERAEESVASPPRHGAARSTEAAVGPLRHGAARLTEAAVGPLRHGAARLTEAAVGPLRHGAARLTEAAVGPLRHGAARLTEAAVGPLRHGAVRLTEAAVGPLRHGAARLTEAAASPLRHGAARLTEAAPAPIRGGAARLSAVVGPRAAPAGALLAVLALGGAGLATNVAIHDAAHAMFLASTSKDFIVHFKRSVARFEPLAGEPRRTLFLNVGRYWAALRETRPEEATRLLAMVEAEAAAATAAEPLNWRVHQALAHMYRAMAAVDPAWAERAREQLERTRAHAPNRRVFGRTIPPPDGLTTHPLADGRHELRWRPSEGAGYHQVSNVRADGSRGTRRYVYDPARSSYIAPITGASGPRRYAVRACDHPGKCSAWAQWPPLPAPDGDAGGARR